MNSVFAQYEELSSPQFAVINLSLRLRLITANFGLDNSSYRAQPHSIIVNYYVFFTTLLAAAERVVTCVGSSNSRSQFFQRKSLLCYITCHCHPLGHERIESWTSGLLLILTRVAKITWGLQSLDLWLQIYNPIWYLFVVLSASSDF